ncbi:TPA: hypothetical protein ACOW35_002850 [Enterococcus faecalis]
MKKEGEKGKKPAKIYVSGYQNGRTDKKNIRSVKCDESIEIINERVKLSLKIKTTNFI